MALSKRPICRPARRFILNLKSLSKYFVQLIPPTLTCKNSESKDCLNWLFVASCVLVSACFFLQHSWCVTVAQVCCVPRFVRKLNLAVTREAVHIQHRSWSWCYKTGGHSLYVGLNEDTISVHRNSLGYQNASQEWLVSIQWALYIQKTFWEVTMIQEGVATQFQGLALKHKPKTEQVEILLAKAKTVDRLRCWSFCFWSCVFKCWVVVQCCDNLRIIKAASAWQKTCGKFGEGQIQPGTVQELSTCADPRKESRVVTSEILALEEKIVTEVKTKMILLLDCAIFWIGPLEKASGKFSAGCESGFVSWQWSGQWNLVPRSFRPETQKTGNLLVDHQSGSWSSWVFWFWYKWTSSRWEWTLLFAI